MEKGGNVWLMDSFNNLHGRNNLKLGRGDVLAVWRGLYWHYGIVVSDDNIIHYLPYPYHWWQEPASVRKCSFEEFCKTGRIIKLYYRVDSSEEREYIISRAIARLGEARYSLLLNNCKHFVDYCIKG